MKWKTVLIIIFLAGIFLQCTKDKPPVFNPEFPEANNTTPYPLEIPSHFPEMKIPSNNPLTVEGVELGRRLFYDKRLSAANTMSCSSCHQLDAGFTDKGEIFSRGESGALGVRNSMSLWNIGFTDFFFWDGRASSLEEQVLMPISSPDEMNQDPQELLKELEGTEYPDYFKAAFGKEEISLEKISKALAQFVRILISDKSEYDNVVLKGAFFSDPDALVGMELMNDLQKGDCLHCHNMGDNLFGDGLFRNNGLDSAATIQDFPDPGRGKISSDPKDFGTFKTPSLRNIALTAPYMHDGRFETLEEVMDHYSEGLHDSPTVNPAELEFVQQGGVNLSTKEKEQIIAFLHTLTDTVSAKYEVFQNPF